KLGGKELERIAPAGEVVGDARRDERRAMIGAPRLELGGTQPVQAHDLLVEAPLERIGDLAREAKAQERHVLLRVMPAVDADQRVWRERMRRLLQHLTPAGGDERLAGIEVSGRLVQHQATIDALLDKEESPVALDHRGDRDARTPSHAAFRVFLRMKSAIRCTPASIACLAAA